MAGSFDTFITATQPFVVATPKSGSTGEFDTFVTVTQPFGEYAAHVAVAYSQSAAGTLTSAGALSRTTSKSMVGALTFTGAIARGIGKSIAGALSFLGSLLPSVYAHLDVEIGDSKVYTVTAGDSALYNVALHDESRS